MIDGSLDDLVWKHSHHSSAAFSRCEKYRYYLQKNLDDSGLFPNEESSGKTLIFVGMNPSVADQDRSDSTVTRVCNYAIRFGMNSVIVLNQMALRSTDPEGLLHVDDPAGSLNKLVFERTLTDWAGKEKELMCAWGVSSGKPGELLKTHADEMWPLLSRHNPKALALTKNGTCRHPLYLGNECTLDPYSHPYSQ